MSPSADVHSPAKEGATREQRMERDLKGAGIQGSERAKVSACDGFRRKDIPEWGREGLGCQEDEEERRPWKIYLQRSD